MDVLDWGQGVQSADSIHVIYLVTSVLFTVKVHVDLLKSAVQNINSLTQVTKLYIYILFCLKVIRS